MPKLWDDPITLINLNKAGSPFRKSGWLVSGRLEGLHTTDYFQYVVVIKDSPAAVRKAE